MSILHCGECDITFHFGTFVVVLEMAFIELLTIVSKGTQTKRPLLTVIEEEDPVQPIDDNSQRLLIGIGYP